MKINMRKFVGFSLIIVSILNYLIIDEQIKYCMWNQNCGILPDGFSAGVLLFLFSIIFFLGGGYFLIDAYLFIDEKHNCVKKHYKEKE